MTGRLEGRRGYRCSDPGLGGRGETPGRGLNMEEMAFDRTWKSIINMEWRGGRSLGPSWHPGWIPSTSQDREGQGQDVRGETVSLILEIWSYHSFYK